MAAIESIYNSNVCRWRHHFLTETSPQRSRARPLRCVLFLWSAKLRVAVKHLPTSVLFIGFAVACQIPAGSEMQYFTGVLSLTIVQVYQIEATKAQLRILNPAYAGPSRLSRAQTCRLLLHFYYYKSLKSLVAIVVFQILCVEVCSFI